MALNFDEIAKDNRNRFSRDPDVWCDAWDAAVYACRSVFTPTAQALTELADACVAYDEAILQCGNSPEKMDSFCTATGQDLDDLYLAWREKAYAVVGKPAPKPSWHEDT